MTTPSEVENHNGEFFVAVLLVAGALSFVGLSYNRAIWDAIIPLVFAWIIADFVASLFETETKGRTTILGHTLPIQRITIAFFVYLGAIVFAEYTTEQLLTPLLLGFLAFLVENAVNRNQAFVCTVSFSAGLLVFLNLRGRTKSDNHDETKHNEENSK